MRVERRRIQTPPPQIFEIPVPPHAPSEIADAQDILNDWYEAAGEALLAQRPRRHTSPIAVEVVMASPKRHADIGTRIPPLLRLLVRCGVIPTHDSTTVRSVSARWGDVERCQLILRRL